MSAPSPLVYEAGAACETGKTPSWDAVATRVVSPETGDEEAAAAATGRPCHAPAGSARPWYRRPEYFTEGCKGNPPPFATDAHIVGFHGGVLHI